MNCEWILEMIDPYLDGELDGEEAAGLETHLERCPACARELRLARQVRDGLRGLPLLTCPEGVIERVEEQIRAARWNRLREWIAAWRIPLWRPVGVLAVALLIAAAAVFQQRERGPSPEEVALAERQVKWTLAYLGQVGQRTGATVRDEVIRERLVEPLEENVRLLMETETM